MIDADANKETLLTPSGMSRAGQAPPSAAGVLLCSRAIHGWLEDPNRITHYPTMNYDSTDPAQRVNLALINGLAALQVGSPQPRDAEP